MKAWPFLFAISLGAACRAAPDGEPTAVASATPAPLLASANPILELNRLDQRRPVPLLPSMAQHQKQNMREHLEAVQAALAAAAESDFDQVALAGKRLGLSERMTGMCQHMGSAAPGFTEQALNFHHTADEIAVAAAKRDGPAVLIALAKTLSACTSCHATYKQEVVARLPD
jgi:cytochrome c556